MVRNLSMTGFRTLFTTAVLVLASAAHAQTASPQFGSVPQPPPGRSSSPVREISTATLLAELRRGGTIIYFRHTSTDFSRDDAKSKSDDDCANQRPLTDKGRDEARAIGAAIRELKIPIGKVLASPRCRTLETAMLIFGRAEKAPEARGGPPTPENTARYAELQKIFSTHPSSGTNLVIASHGNPFYGTAGPPYLAEGEAAVVRPLGKDFEVIGRVRWDGWSALAKPGP
jgi:phosphohistidine phosphatase SixA